MPDEHKEKKEFEMSLGVMPHLIVALNSKCSCEKEFNLSLGEKHNKWYHNFTCSICGNMYEVSGAKIDRDEVDEVIQDIVDKATEKEEEDDDEKDGEKWK